MKNVKLISLFISMLIFYSSHSQISSSIEKTLENKSNKNKKEILITGTITDCENVPLSGITITNLNSKTISLSDSEGKYKIIAHNKDVLLYFLIGFVSQRIEVKEQATIDIKLKMLPKSNQGTIMIKKPIIYLYPTQKTEITLELDFKGKLLTTFPKYDKKWDVTAYPDGKIYDKKTNRFYNSLFWDGEYNFPKEHYMYKNGFIVAKNDLLPFLIKKLEIVGLNTNEANDFIQYWLPELEKNQNTFIHFWINESYDEISKNNVLPKPDTSIRIFMGYYAVDKKFEIQEQKLTKTERHGFTLVEWGGSDMSIAIKELKLF